MNLALIVNHILSFAVVMLCWWLAHLSGSRPGPLGRVTAVAYGVLAVATIAVALFRHLSIDSQWVAIAYKASIILLFVVNAKLIHGRLFMQGRVAEASDQNGVP